MVLISLVFAQNKTILMPALIPLSNNNI